MKGIENHCYKMGGDEFIVIVTGSSVDRLESIINDIQQIFVRPWFLKGEDYYCTISAGVAFFPTDASNVEDVIRRADIALFNAKKEGKNRIEFYNEAIDGTSTKRLDLEKNMRKATMNECDEFTVYFQPDYKREGGGCLCRCRGSCQMEFSNHGLYKSG